MIIAVMAIMMTVAVQEVSVFMQREREAELIFRGQQYVEAIRLYRLKYGRYPMRMKEIWEADPKVIRKPFKDPFTESGEWELIFLGQDGNQIGGQGGQAGQNASGSRTGRNRRGAGRQTRFGASPGATPGPSEGTTSSSRGVRQQGGEKIGPIIGVKSTYCKDSFKVYEGRTRICDWQFVFREQQRQGQGGSQPPPQQPTEQPGDDLPFGTQPRQPEGTPVP
jgi:type II secretory pathway pseudopilin PulG